MGSTRDARRAGREAASKAKASIVTAPKRVETAPLVVSLGINLVAICLVHRANGTPST